MHELLPKCPALVFRAQRLWRRDREGAGAVKGHGDGGTVGVDSIGTRWGTDARREGRVHGRGWRSRKWRGESWDALLFVWRGGGRDGVLKPWEVVSGGDGRRGWADHLDATDSPRSEHSWTARLRSATRRGSIVVTAQPSSCSPSFSSSPLSSSAASPFPVLAHPQGVQPMPPAVSPSFSVQACIVHRHPSSHPTLSRWPHRRSSRTPFFNRFLPLHPPHLHCQRR